MRDMGVPIRRNVMAGWFISTADLVRPLWEVMKDEMKKLKTINADETFGQVDLSRKVLTIIWSGLNSYQQQSKKS